MDVRTYVHSKKEEKWHFWRVRIKKFSLFYPPDTKTKDKKTPIYKPRFRCQNQRFFIQQSFKLFVFWTREILEMEPSKKKITKRIEHFDDRKRVKEGDIKIILGYYSSRIYQDSSHTNSVIQILWVDRLHSEN